MAEHRVRPARHKGQLNFESELRTALYAFGDDVKPLPETVRVLDEIVTDYVIDTVQTAAKVATISNRGKVKADDFKFAIRHDEIGTGRVKELMHTEAELKNARKQFDPSEGIIGRERGGRGRKKKVDESMLHSDDGKVKTEKQDHQFGDKIDEDDLDEDDL